MKIKCSKCNGDGWHTDHSSEHYADDSLSCEEAGCPEQVACHNCAGQGYYEEIPQ